MTDQDLNSKPIDWETIYRVSARKQHAPYHQIQKLATICGEFPRGYSDFLETFGVGWLNDIQILGYEEILASVGAFRDSLNEWAAMCFDAGAPEPIAAEVRNNAVVLARTGWGAGYYCSATLPGILWYVPRSQDWEDHPDEIPMGFSNPFVHKHSSGLISHHGQDDIVFTPSIARSQMRLVATPRSYPIDLEPECRFIEEYIRFDKKSVARYRVTYYRQLLSLAVHCSATDQSVQMILEFDECDRQEVEKIVERMSTNTGVRKA